MVENQTGTSIDRKRVNLQECRWMTQGEWDQVTRAGLQYQQGGLFGPGFGGILEFHFL